MADTAAETLADNLWRVKEAYRFFLDGSDEELHDFGISRAEALAKARALDRALPHDIRTETGAWAKEAFATSTLAVSSSSVSSIGNGSLTKIDIDDVIAKVPGWLYYVAAIYFCSALLWTVSLCEMPDMRTAKDAVFHLVVMIFTIWCAQRFLKYFGAIIHLMSASKKS